MTTSNLKVLYVVKRYAQLSQTFVVRELIGLESIGVTVGVDALGQNDSGIRHADVEMVAAEVRFLPRRPMVSRLPVLGAHVRGFVRHPARWLRTAVVEGRHDLRRFLQAGLVADRVHAQRFDLIHAHFATAAADVARMASSLSGVPFTVTAHAKDIYSDQHAPRLAARLGAAAHVVTVSAFNVDHLRGLLPSVPVSLVRNAVVVGPEGSPVGQGPVLCVARLVEKKGIDALLRAVALVVQGCPGLTLEIVGGGELRESLGALAVDLGVGDIVTFLGSLPADQVAEAYAQASMFVLPCRIGADGDRDGLPTVIVEAMAHRLAVVSTDIIGIGEVVRHGETGLLVPEDDVDSLATAIEKLWHDPSLRAFLGANGRQLVADEFDPFTSACELRSIFRGALARPT